MTILQKKVAVSQKTLDIWDNWSIKEMKIDLKDEKESVTGEQHVDRAGHLRKYPVKQGYER
jgi:hypothetical protein